MTGTGASSAPAASLSPSSLNFSNQSVGVSSTAQAVTLSNAGNAALSITGITTAGDFGQTNGCGASLAAGARCTINVVFVPTAAGTRSGTLSIVDNASGSPHTASLTGSGQAAPIASASPTSLTFGNQATGSASAPQVVTLTNTGTVSLIISSVTSTSTSFPLTNNCGSTLAAGAKCTVSVAFRPPSAGPWGGALVIADNASGGLQVVSLNGTGAAPLASLSPTALTFASGSYNSASAAQVITLSNLGASPLAITGITTTATPFTASSNCGASLAAGASCAISVTFTRPYFGSTTATLNVADNAANSPQTASLTMAGSSSLVSLSPSSLSFSPQTVGTTSAAQTVTVKNEDTAAVTISRVSANSASFAASSSCPGSLAAGASCSIAVTFTPAASADTSGTLTVTDGATNSPQTASLLGNGTGPAVAFSTPAVNFGSQPVASPGGPQILALVNVGSAALTVASITATGDFAQTNNCGATLAAGASCEASVTFTPTVAGTRSGIFTVTDNAAGGSQTVSLSGTGAAAATPAANLSPNSLTFPSQALNSASGAQAVTLSNPGGAALNLTGITASGDFAQTNNCGSSVATGASCTMNVTFTPTASGTRGGTLTVTDNAAGGSQTVSLSGSGAAAATPAAASLSPTTVSFGSVAVGSSSTQAVILSNTGGSPLNVASVTSTPGSFTQTNNCGTSLASGAKCTINVNFQPSASGTFNASLSVSDSATGSPHSAGLSGTGIAGTATASLSVSSLLFGSVVKNTTSSARSVTLTNTGGTTLSIVSITASGDFNQTNTCGASLAAKASCTISVTFTPTQDGGRAGTLTVTDNATGGPQTVSLSGNGLF